MITFLSRLRRSPRAPVWIKARDLAKRVNIDAAVLVLDVLGPDEFVGPVILPGSEPTLE
jgi:hypothetical protein